MQVKILFYFVVYGLAGNKSDLYLKSTVNEGEARRYADEINAVFANTSALTNSGINELYEELAEKFIKEQKDKKVDSRISIDIKKKKGTCCRGTKEKKHEIRITRVSEGIDC